MPLSDTMINVFLSVAETQSFTKSARALYLSQQGISKNIARLEEYLGVCLFERSTRSVVLTAAGQEYYVFFRDAARAFHQVSQKLQSRARDSDNLLRIGIMERLTIDDFIGELVARQQKTHDELHLEWSYHPGTVLETMLDDGELDLYISFANPTAGQEKIRSMHILDSEQQLLISEHFPGGEMLKTPSDLQHLPLFLFRNVNSSDNPETDIQEFRSHHVTPDFQPQDIRVLASEADAKLAVTLCQGITISNSRCDLAKASGLRAVPLNRNNEIHCCWRTSDNKPSLPCLLNILSAMRL